MAPDQFISMAPLVGERFQRNIDDNRLTFAVMGHG